VIALGYDDPTVRGMVSLTPAQFSFSLCLEGNKSLQFLFEQFERRSGETSKSSYRPF